MALETMKESLREDIKYHSRAASFWLTFFNEMQRTDGVNFVFGNYLVKIEKNWGAIGCNELEEPLIDAVREFAQKMCENHARIRFQLEVELQGLIESKEN